MKQNKLIWSAEEIINMQYPNLGAKNKKLSIFRYNKTTLNKKFIDVNELLKGRLCDECLKEIVKQVRGNKYKLNMVR